MNQKLIEDNMNLVYFLVQRYYPTFITDEDIIQSGMIGLCLASRKWDESKGTFSTFASQCILNEIRREFKKRSRSVNAISLENKRYTDDGDRATLGEFVVGEEDVDFVDYDSFNKCLSPLDRKIVKYRQFGLTCREIGEKLGYSTSHINQRLRIIRHLWRKVNGN